MIRLHRERNATAVHPNFTGAARTGFNLDLLMQKRDGSLDKKGGHKWDSSVWKAAKEQLLKESHNKCAYCETPVKVIAPGDVEHFRPKGRYWWLAYAYDNYLVSCLACNQQYKKDFFPIANASKQLQGPPVSADTTNNALRALAPFLTVDPVADELGMPLAQFVKDISAEGALILNPYFDDPADYLAYQPILINKEVVITPAKPQYKPILKACETYFGINRKELMDLRFQHYCTYMTYKCALASSVLEGALKKMITDRLTEMTDAAWPYAGMIRYFETRKPESLPWDFDIKLI